ncbi:hypothetical protein [Niabella drilacis]|uniref:Uncharacterized protein n=1 Tax=Niabella drilacis (strain DSM 25811 / CCM 8410 / CCUG 62505 / LMG 26954 / E90) TaxID=1285928 RepID=A0A1G6R5A9_NIADE|nr:hypothetical protein [Niabella drilacis]SDC99830.1 hypothetical protein SAMN04487894_105153 [Niabella drilacis]
MKKTGNEAAIQEKKVWIYPSRPPADRGRVPFLVLPGDRTRKKSKKPAGGAAAVLVLLAVLLYSAPAAAQAIRLQTQYATVTISNKGWITSIKSRGSGREYCPAGQPSALMSLYSNRQYILPEAAKREKNGRLVLSYPNGSRATLQLEQKQPYLKFKLIELTQRDHIDNIVWGPYKTIISKKIGDLISVVRNDDFAIGMLGLDDNTTSGPPTEGDMSFMYYYIHSPDPQKYPLPPHLKEGQTFSIGGDGISDVAFYSQPEEYFRMNYGNGAQLEPAFGSSICMHSRNRLKEQMIRFPYYPDNIDGKANSARYQLVTPTNAGYIGSSIAFYACPDMQGLNTIEKVVLAEGLPHPTIDGKWIKDPAAYRPDMAWWGPHDSLASYARQLKLTSVQDEGLGEYYPDRVQPWDGKRITLNGKRDIPVPQFGKMMQQQGIRYGLHTLCEFLQPGRNRDVAPVPSDSLAIMQRTVLTKDIGREDTVITVADTAYFNEFGGWEGNHTNVLKIGKELIEYDGITRTAPYTFLKIKRGFHGTARGSYKAGTTIVKLQPNCYHGFAPDMNLQDEYAGFYGKWLADGGMDYIDFDGLESCVYQGHGQYSFKRFFRGLFDSYQRNGGRYLRVMGSAIQEGSWHYMSVCNVGGGDHMFSPVLNKWGIEGKDMRYVFESSYFPATFGIQSYQADWSLYDAENLQAKSIGWDATYMLGLSQQTVEASAEKKAIFSAYRTWENARAAAVFTKAHKEKLKDLDYKFHLEQTGARSFLLYPVKENRFRDLAYTVNGAALPLQNVFEAQPLEFSIKMNMPKEVTVEGLKMITPGGQELTVNKTLSGGQYIIYKNGQLYHADRGRKLLDIIPVNEPLQISRGEGRFKISALHAGSEKVKMELVVPVIGKPEKI